MRFCSGIRFHQANNNFFHELFIFAFRDSNFESNETLMELSFNVLKVQFYS